MTKMAFDPEAKLSDVLAGGYHLTARLQALLARPLDSRGQEEAMAFSQELARVFMVSLSMLKQPDDSKRTLMMAPGIRIGDCFGVCTLAKDKLFSRVAVSSHKNIREAEFTRKEVTSEPHKDGYQWQKYGQKNIQNCSFMRYYFRCQDRRCNAKKKVQRKDSSSSDDDGAPMFEVTYVNEHTCHRHVALAKNDVADNKSLPPTTTTTTALNKAAENTGCRNGGSLFDLLHQENEAIVSCLATVISGTAPGAEPGARPAAYVPRPPSADGSCMADDAGAMDFSWEDSSSSFWPAEAGELMDLCDDDVHMDAARWFVDTVWPQYHT